MIRTLIILTLFLAAASSLQAQVTGTLAGRITDTTGKPLLRATIKVEETRQGAYSRDNGNYIVAGVRAGTYQITIAFVGYQIEKRTVTINVNQQTTLDVQLREREPGNDTIEIPPRYPNPDRPRPFPRPGEEDLSRTARTSIIEAVALQSGIVTTPRKVQDIIPIIMLQCASVIQRYR